MKMCIRDSVIWVVFFVFAFGWILLASFSTTREIFSGTLLDSGVHLENYTNVWKDNNVGRYFINSILCSALSCALIILISAPAAYVPVSYTHLACAMAGAASLYTCTARTFWE